MEITIILKTFILGWWLSTFEPIQNIIDKYIKPRIKNHYLKKSLSCPMCLSFWSTIFIYQDFYSACAAAMLAATYNKIINAFKTY